MRAFQLRAIVLLSALALTTTAIHAQDTGNAEFLSQVTGVLKTAEGGDLSSLDAQVKPLIADPWFQTLDGPNRRRLLSLAARGAWFADDLPPAIALMQRAVAADGNDPDDWFRLALMHADAGQLQHSAALLAPLVERWPALVNNLPRVNVMQLIFRLESGDLHRFRLMRALFDAGWTASDRGADEAWRELALDELARGDAAAAARVVARIDEPLTLAGLRSDGRFDVIAPALATRPSVEAAASGWVERLEQLTSEHPNRLDLASDLGDALLTAGRHVEALAVSDAALQALAAGPDSFENTTDRVWIMNNRAIALRRMGRVDEAVAELDQARRLDEGEGTNISQMLNLGTLLCRLGRADEAARLPAPGTAMTGYGRMVQAALEHCIALQLARPADARNALRHMQDHRSDAGLLLVEALLREGRVADAGHELIRALGSGDTRASALEYVQSFERSPSLPADKKLDAAFEALLKRADVRDAIDRVGRIHRYAIYARTGIG